MKLYRPPAFLLVLTLVIATFAPAFPGNAFAASAPYVSTVFMNGYAIEIDEGGHNTEEESLRGEIFIQFTGGSSETRGEGMSTGAVVPNFSVITFINRSTGAKLSMPAIPRSVATIEKSQFIGNWKKHPDGYYNVYSIIYRDLKPDTVYYVYLTGFRDWRGVEMASRGFGFKTGTDSNRPPAPPIYPNPPPPTPLPSLPALQPADYPPYVVTFEAIGATTNGSVIVNAPTKGCLRFQFNTALTTTSPGRITLTTLGASTLSADNPIVLNPSHGDFTDGDQTYEITYAALSAGATYIVDIDHFWDADSTPHEMFEDKRVLTVDTTKLPNSPIPTPQPTPKPPDSGGGGGGWHPSPPQNKPTDGGIGGNPGKPSNPGTPAPPDWPFVDVPEDSWSRGDIEFVYENDIMEGTASNLFSPQMELTRGMVATILYRMAGRPAVDSVQSSDATSEFWDVMGSQYYSLPILWGARQHLLLGYADGAFRPDAPVARQELVAMLIRYAKWKGMEIPATRDYISFADQNEIHEYARQYIEQAYRAGIIEGRPDRLMAPLESTTREEAAAILHRFTKLAAH